MSEAIETHAASRAEAARLAQDKEEATQHARHDLELRQQQVDYDDRIKVLTIHQFGLATSCLVRHLAQSICVPYCSSVAHPQEEAVDVQDNRDLTKQRQRGAVEADRSQESAANMQQQVDELARELRQTQLQIQDLQHALQRAQAEHQEGLQAAEKLRELAQDAGVWHTKELQVHYLCTSIERCNCPIKNT